MLRFLSEMGHHESMHVILMNYQLTENMSCRRARSPAPASTRTTHYRIGGRYSAAWTWASGTKPLLLLPSCILKQNIGGQSHESGHQTGNFGEDIVTFFCTYSHFGEISWLGLWRCTVASRALLVSIFGLSRQFYYDL